MCLSSIHICLHFLSPPKAQRYISSASCGGLYALCFLCEFPDDLAICHIAFSMYFLIYFITGFTTKQENPSKSFIIKLLFFQLCFSIYAPLIIGSLLPFYGPKSDSIYILPLILLFITTFYFKRITSPILDKYFSVYIDEGKLQYWQKINLLQIRENLLSDHNVQLKLTHYGLYNALVYPEQKLIVMDKWIFDNLTPQEVIAFILHEIGHLCDPQMKHRVYRDFGFYLLFILSCYLLQFGGLLAIIGMLVSFFGLVGIIFNTILLKTEATADQYVQSYGCHLEYDLLNGLSKVRQVANIDKDVCKKSNQGHLDESERLLLFHNVTIEEIIQSRNSFRKSNMRLKSGQRYFFYTSILIVLFLTLKIFSMLDSEPLPTFENPVTLIELESEYDHSLYESDRYNSSSELNKLIQMYPRSDRKCPEASINFVKTKFSNEFESTKQYNHIKNRLLLSLQTCEDNEISGKIFATIAHYASLRYELKDSLDLYKKAAFKNPDKYQHYVYFIQLSSKNIDIINKKISSIDLANPLYTSTKWKLLYLQLFNNVKYHPDKIDHTLYYLLNNLDRHSDLSPAYFWRCINQIQDGSIEFTKSWLNLITKIFPNKYGTDHIQCLLKFKNNESVLINLEESLTLREELTSEALTNYFILKLRLALLYKDQEEIDNILKSLDGNSHRNLFYHSKTQYYLWTSWVAWNNNKPTKNLLPLLDQFIPSQSEIYQIDMVKKMKPDYSYSKN